MDNNGTTLQGPFLLATELDLVSTTTVAGTLYGIAFTLFCLYVHPLLPQLRDGDQKRRAKFMLGYSSIIMLCGFYSLVQNAWVTQDAYIKHGDYPGGPYRYIQSTFRTQPAIAVGYICQLAVDTLTSAIQIWRVWIIWNATSYARVVIVPPSLCFLTLIELRTVIIQTTLSTVEVIELDTKTGIAEVAIQVATTILCTASICLYLIYQQWQQRKLIGPANGSTGHMKIVAMLIESYTLESLWVLMSGILISHPVSAFFGEGKVYIEIIAYLLVQYRVVRGKAYESQRGQSNMSSMHWNHSNHATTQLEDTGEAANDHHVPVKPDANVLQVSTMA